MSLLSPGPSESNPHIREVRAAAQRIGQKVAPEHLALIDAAARWHDTGREFADQKHPQAGVWTLRLHPRFWGLRRKLSKEDWRILLEAVREHSSKTGTPQHPVARVVADADRIGYPADRTPLKHEIGYLMAVKKLDEARALREASEYFAKKYGRGGPAWKGVSYDATKEEMRQRFLPIADAYEAGDWSTLKRLARE